MYRTLLVPLDGSPTSTHALTLAWSVARGSGAALRLVHVHTPTDIIYVRGMPVVDDQLRSLGRLHERAYLQQIADRLMAEAPVNVTWSNPDRDGSIAGALAREALNSNSSLIVLATHGRRGVERAVCGSVAEDLLRISPVPLLVLRCGEAQSAAEGLPRRPRILVPLDGSPLSEAIVSHATALGRPLDAEYTLLRVVRPVQRNGEPCPACAYDVSATDWDQSRAQAYLDHLARRLRNDGLRVTTEVRISAHPAEAILREAQVYQNHLIAMATHGRRGLARFLAGSVTDEVLHAAQLPLLVVRPRVRVDGMAGRRLRADNPIMSLALASL